VDRSPGRCIPSPSQRHSWRGVLDYAAHQPQAMYFQVKKKKKFPASRQGQRHTHLCASPPQIAQMCDMINIREKQRRQDNNLFKPHPSNSRSPATPEIGRAVLPGRMSRSQPPGRGPSAFLSFEHLSGDIVSISPRRSECRAVWGVPSYECTSREMYSM